MLRLVLPKGSLERATIELFEAADAPWESVKDLPDGLLSTIVP